MNDILKLVGQSFFTGMTGLVISVGFILKYGHQAQPASRIAFPALIFYSTLLGTSLPTLHYFIKK